MPPPTRDWATGLPTAISPPVPRMHSAERLRCSRDSADYAYHLGISLFSAGEPMQAITPLEQSLRIDLTSVDAHLVLGSVLSRVGRRADADAQWRIVLSLDAKSSAALEYLSRDLLVDGNYVAVIDLLRPVEISGKLSAASAVNLSVAYTKAGLLSNAYDVLQTALRTNPSSVQVIEALSAVLVMLDRYQDANQILAVVARQYPGRRGIANPLSASAGADSRPGSRATLRAAPQSRSKPLGVALSDGPLAAKCPRLHGGSDLVREFRDAQS